jgi:hypothetical protein
MTLFRSRLFALGFCAGLLLAAAYAARAGTLGYFL